MAIVHEVHLSMLEVFVMVAFYAWRKAAITLMGALFLLDSLDALIPGLVDWLFSA